MTISIKPDGSLIELRLDQCNTKLSTDQKIVFELQLEHHDVVILSPSFCTPLIAKTGAPLSFFIVTDDEFETLYRADKDASKALVNMFLKLRPWRGEKRIKDQPLYTSVATALANIDCAYLGNTFAFADGRIKNKDGALVALLRESTRNAYGRLKHLFQVDIQPTGLSAALPPGLYDAAWFVFDAVADAAKSEHPFCEWQDIKTADYLKGIAPGETRPYLIDTPFEFKLDETARLENYHPIYITDKPKLNLGQLTDVHVSSRQFVFRQSQARPPGMAEVQKTQERFFCQVLQNADPGDSKPLGTQVNVTFETLKDLLDNLGCSDIDAILLTGDLIDHNHNFDPSTQADWRQHFQTPGNAWEALHSAHHEDATRYPKYIDDRIVYSLIKYVYDRYGIPVFLVQGNHELYTQPYGISPRIMLGLMRANEGVPADHNLTIYEALLMYGPDYNHVRTTGRFTATNVDWLHNMLTPLTDYRFVYGEQSFVGLTWGNDEDIISNKVQGGGSLPRAPDSVSAAQYELVQAAVKEGSERILFTHFTFASYGTHIALGDTGKINYNNSFKSYDNYDEGSFKQRRYEMYTLLAEQRIDYAFAGHSHRAGLYELLSFSNGARPHLEVRGHRMTGPGYRPDFKGVRIITSGCGGPIGVQNHYEVNAKVLGEKHEGLGSAGLDRPSGTKLTLNGTEHIALALPSSAVPQAQPRFAVALDYFDLLKERVFASFESKTDDDAVFAIELCNKLPLLPFIKWMSLFAYREGKWVKSALTVKQEAGTHKLEVKMEAGDWKDFRKDVLKEKNVVLFLSTNFTDALGATTGYNVYNFDSAWLMRVEVKPRMRIEGYGEDAHEVPAGGYTVKRHGIFGEIPDFIWHRDEFPKLYPYKRKIKKRD